ncbi:MAG: hypothetical protein OXN97_19460 [Bryobacterales bacterium]|nr:hypothetical protein [Bryobacterales bacterium]
MKTQELQTLISKILVVGLLGLAGALADANHLMAQDTCPLPPGVAPAEALSVTAQQVEQGSASLKDFALAARDRYGALTQEFETLEGIAHSGCLVRQEGSPSRSGSTYIVTLTPDGRVFVHAKDMSLSGRQVNPFIYGEILSALGVSSSDLARLSSPDPSVVAQAGASIFGTLLQQPDGPFDATTPVPGLRPGIPGASGYAAVYMSANLGVPLLLLAGFDLNESHVTQEEIDYGDPAVTAKDVVDRETLKAFVAEALKFIVDTVATGDPNAYSKARIALRDPNGPWRHGPVYLYILDRNSNIILLHGAFADRFELQPLVATVRDAVTGKLVLPQVIAAANSSPEGGFVEYFFDDPSDGTDSADIPKVGYARALVDAVRTADGTPFHLNVIVGSGFYRSSPAGGPAVTSGCADRSISASAVRTQSDIRAFVECAEVYLAEHGTAEARRAFNEDERWKHGSIYVFARSIARSGRNSTAFVHPPDPSRQGRLWGETIDDFGTDLYLEIDRLLQAVDAGWVYYSFPNPATGRRVPKASYVIEVDWEGEPAFIGAGIYSGDWPGTCYADEVNAAALGANPSAETLREFVRCAALAVESDGYFAKEELEGNARWSDGEHYVYVLDMTANQVMSGNQVRINGKALHEWGRGGEQFGGRDMVTVGGTFGESYVYYRSHNPLTGALKAKVGFLKSVVAQGVPLLVGSGYYVGPEPAGSGPVCADNFVEAAAVRTRADLQAFVQCAAEYALEHGEGEARRAFNEDARWKAGSIYLFVDGVQPSGMNSLAHVYARDPSREGSVWGEPILGFGNDYFYELHRMLSLVDQGWIYYLSEHPATGRRQPKSSYMIEIDWNGDRAAIGAGIYARDFPGACDPADVNAADLAAHASDQRLQEFVRCAAMEVESSGYFAGPVLSRDPRWKHGPTYIFGINVETGAVEFSGNPASFATSGRIPELLFDGRNAIEAGALFGEMFWYYNFHNPATGDVEAKTAFLKLVRAQGVPLLVGSGYNP